MPLRALIYSKAPLTPESLAPVFRGVGLEGEFCNDALSAIEKGTKQAFSCLIVDWADQPETGFLLRRARESGSNRNAVTIAIVDHEPASAEMRDNRLDFLLYRPITVGEAAAVLAKACQQMRVQTPLVESEAAQPQGDPEAGEEEAKPEYPALLPVTAAVPQPHQPVETPAAVYDEGFPEELPGDDEFFSEPDRREVAPPRAGRVFSFRTIGAAGLALVAALCLWRSRNTIQYLAHTREGVFEVMQESVAALFFTNKSGAQPVDAVIADSQEDAYFVRGSAGGGKQPRLGIVPAEVRVPEGYTQLPRALDFPLPTPAYTPTELPPIRVERGPVPDSLRGALPIGPPVIATDPAHLMPVSTPAPPIPQFNEPVRLSEEATRTTLVRRVDPVYPAGDAAQKLQGPVVLDALIGRDGSVEDLKLVRGYFVLARAAIAAVKQWHFQPYVVNGHPAKVQTTITINFTRPRG